MKITVKSFLLITVMMTSQLIVLGQTVKPNYPTAELSTKELTDKFLELCDHAIIELQLPYFLPLRKTSETGKERKITFWMDSYAVRALGVAYDLSGKEKYLTAMKDWSDLMITLQQKMIPKGGYYMNYGRGPFETKGAWYVADCGEISMAVLATAARCKNPMEKRRYIKSVESFANLVLENYIGPNGGITNGLWPLFDGEWWCSTAYVGQVFFILYDETGDKRYLEAALNAVNWFVQLESIFKRSKDPNFIEKNPYPSPVSISGRIHTELSLYHAGFRQIFSGDYPQIDKGTKKEITYYVNMAADNLGGKGLSETYEKYIYPKPHSSIGALPFHIYVLVGNGLAPKEMLKIADKELYRCIWEVFSYDKIWLTGFTSCTMMSMAEKLSPGSVLRRSKPLYKIVSKSQ